MLAATMVLTSVPVLAASGTKTAVLNTAKVSFNGGPVQNIQCYNIDGYNYVRARDITNNLNMWIFDYKSGQTGIMVDSTMPAPSKNAMEKLTQKTAKVQMKPAELSYNAMITETECFLLNGRYYFKLADFAAASQHTLDIFLETVDVEAKDNIAQEPLQEKFDAISVEWNDDTKVIDVKRTTTDLLKVFNDIRANSGNPVATKPSEAESDTNNTADTNKKGTPVIAGFEDYHNDGQPPLTEAPKEGEVLANILIDESKGAYLGSDFKRANLDNYTIPYRKIGPIGECTWYARARFLETVGISTLYEKYWSGAVHEWVDYTIKNNLSYVKATTDPYAIQPRSIAIWDKHAVFVEWVDYDSEGKPQTVYFTEANSGHEYMNGESVNGMKNGRYYPDFDCKVQKLSIEDFIHRSDFAGRYFVGYIMEK